MDRRNVIFIIIYALIFSGVVAFKFIHNTKSVKLGEEFSLEKGQVISVGTSDLTKIKLVSINEYDCGSDNCFGLQYKILVNGDEYIISTIPSSTKIYGNYDLDAVEGDEDRIVLKMYEKVG